MKDSAFSPRVASSPSCSPGSSLSPLFQDLTRQGPTRPSLTSWHDVCVHLTILNTILILLIVQVCKKRIRAPHATRTKFALSSQQSPPFMNIKNPFAPGRMPSKYAISPIDLNPSFHAAAAAWYRTRHCKPNRLFPAGQRICL